MRWARCGWHVLIRRPSGHPPEAHRSLGFQRSEFSVQGIIKRFPITGRRAFAARFFSELRPFLGGWSYSAAYFSYPLSCPLNGPLSDLLVHPRPMSAIYSLHSPIHRRPCLLLDDAFWRGIDGGRGEATGLMRAGSTARLNRVTRCRAVPPLRAKGVRRRRIGGQWPGAAPGVAPACPRPLACAC